jgi:hypothetical protein
MLTECYIRDQYETELVFLCVSAEIARQLQRDLLVTAFNWTEQDIADGFKI